MKQIKCEHCGREFPLEEERAGDKIHCPHCGDYLYTVVAPEPNKYSEQNPYHREEPKK